MFILRGYEHFLCIISGPVFVSGGRPYKQSFVLATLARALRVPIACAVGVRFRVRFPVTYIYSIHRDIWLPPMYNRFYGIVGTHYFRYVYDVKNKCDLIKSSIGIRSQVQIASLSHNTQENKGAFLKTTVVYTVSSM